MSKSLSRKTFPFAIPNQTPLYLAPMAGVSESPFRRLCHGHGADVVVTEFLSAEGIRRENEATISKLRFSAEERPIGVQIFGAEPAAMAAARVVKAEGSNRGGVVACDFTDSVTSRIKYIF